jgi:tetratricopeptide (TPR) repeat protein/tRNA A-37 threonylcarbamoyl transferase component Bud32
VSAELRDQVQLSLGTAYAIERELGGGGMSRTYVAMEQALSRRVVVKVLSPELAAGVSVDRFRREIMLAAKLQHPHVVPVLSSGDAGGLPWFTMPYVEGESLRARLARGSMGIGEITGILRDVARALEFAHDHGVVHRDIKPDNVLLAGSSATVTDFGIAKAITAARSGPEGSTLTMAGTSIGSPAYMAPEQAAGDPNIDHRSDIYAFGCMAYELLSGRPPFIGQSPAKLLGAHLGETPRDVRELRGDVPPALADLVMRCLEKDPDARPAQARDLVRVLDSVTSSGATAAAPAILSPRIRAGRALAVWAAATALVGLTAWAATASIGLPGWVLPGSLGVMLAGLPAILFTAWVQRTTQKAYTATPTFTPGGTPTGQGTLMTLAMKASPHVSWQRTWMGGAIAVGTFVVLVVGWMVMRALGIGPAGSLMGRGAFGAKEKLVVADFRSPASDSTLGATVAEAIRTDLTQSVNLSVMTRAAVREVMQLMRKDPTASMAYETAREVATREGAKALLDGAVDRVGTGYVVSARLVSALDGGELATFRTTAANDGELIASLGQLAKDIRERVGESLKSIRDTKALERVTTASLPALKKYVDGMYVIEALDDRERGRDMLYEAVSIDSTFAMAWRRIAASYAGQGSGRAAQMAAIEKAYRYRERLSDNERLTTEAGYYSYGPTPDLDRTIAAYEALLERDSLSSPALNNGGLRYLAKRDPVRAEELLRRAIAIPEPFGGSFGNLIQAQLAQGKVAAAESTAAAFRVALPSSAGHWQSEAYIATARQDFDSVQRLAQRVFADPKAATQRDFSALTIGQVMAIHGRIRDAMRWIGEAEAVAAQQSDTKMPVLRASLDSAWLRAFFLGDTAGAREQIRRALAKIPMESLPPSERQWDYLLGIAEVTGDEAGARSALQSLERDFPQMGVEQASGALARARAALEMAAGRPTQAIPLFREADRTYASCDRCAMINLARAFDLAGQRDSAIAYFQKFIDTPRSMMFEDQDWLAGTYKRLGELYEAAGDLPKAATNLEKFIELWKDADPELQPKVRDARERLQRIRAELARRG